MREESASSDCTEETYLTPNSLKPDQPDETTKIQVEPEDPEIRLVLIYHQCDQIWRIFATLAHH